MEEIIKKLQAALDKAASSETKKWFENYLKNAIEYRGVKTPVVMLLVDNWYKKEKLNEKPVTFQLKLACNLLSQEKAEDKFAGIIYIQQYLLKSADTETLLKKFDALFRKGVFFDWSSTDWFCMRVLNRIVVSNGMRAAEIIALWRRSDNLWQRRASIVSFHSAAKHEEFHPIINKIIADLVIENERFIQTGIGWVISSLSRRYPDHAAMMVDQHFHQLSGEVIRRHTKYLPEHEHYIKLKRRK